MQKKYKKIKINRKFKEEILLLKNYPIGLENKRSNSES